MKKLTIEEAQAIIEAHEIDVAMENEEEAEMLKANNPELYAAYQKLQAIANDE